MCWRYSKSSTRTRNERNEWENEPGWCSIGRGQGLWQSGVRTATVVQILKTQGVQVSYWHLNSLCHLRSLHTLPNLQRFYCIPRGSCCQQSVSISCTPGSPRQQKAPMSQQLSQSTGVQAACALHSLNHCCLLQVPSRQQCWLQRWPSATDAPSFQTPSHPSFSWVGVLICLRAGRIFRWIWTDWNRLSGEKVESPWNCSRDLWLQHLVTWFSGEHDGDELDLRGFLQP